MRAVVLLCGAWCALLGDAAASGTVSPSTQAYYWCIGRYGAEYCPSSGTGNYTYPSAVAAQNDEVSRTQSANTSCVVTAID